MRDLLRYNSYMYIALWHLSTVLIGKLFSWYVIGRDAVRRPSDVELSATIGTNEAVRYPNAADPTDENNPSHTPSSPQCAAKTQRLRKVVTHTPRPAHDGW